MVCIVYNMGWSKGQAGWALGGFARSVLVMGEWSVSQWVVGAKSFQKYMVCIVNNVPKLRNG